MLIEIEVVDEELFERRVVKDGSFNVTQSRGELEAWIAKTSSAKQRAWKRQHDHISTNLPACIGWGLRKRRILLRLYDLMIL